MTDMYEAELTASREEIATVLSGVVDGITVGAVRLDDEESTLVVEIPDELELQIECEVEDDEQSLEFELEWPTADADIGESAHSTANDAGTPAEQSLNATSEYIEIEESLVDTEAARSSSVGTAATTQTHARFELFRDRSNEWRWRLRHRNGNVIATSGEGYTQKHNARKGLRSVMQNATGAVVTDETKE